MGKGEAETDKGSDLSPSLCVRNTCTKTAREAKWPCFKLYCKGQTFLPELTAAESCYLPAGLGKTRVGPKLGLYVSKGSSLTRTDQFTNGETWLEFGILGHGGCSKEHVYTESEQARGSLGC